jgi:hypothetical protein
MSKNSGPNYEKGYTDRKLDRDYEKPHSVLDIALSGPKTAHEHLVDNEEYEAGWNRQAKDSGTKD